MGLRTVNLTVSTGSMTGSVMESANPNALRSFIIAWTSTAGGAANCTIPVAGTLVGFETKPGSGGTQPSANYDVTLSDPYGVDLLATAGQNRSNSTAERVAAFENFTAQKPFTSPLTLDITNAGNAKTGTVIIYVRP